MDLHNLTVSGTSTLSDHYNKTNIDNLLLAKAPLAFPSFVGGVTTPNLTIVVDATVSGDSAVRGHLFVSGTGKQITAKQVIAPSAATLEIGVPLA